MLGSFSAFDLEVEDKTNQLCLQQEEFQHKGVKKHVGRGSQSQAFLPHPWVLTMIGGSLCKQRMGAGEGTWAVKRWSHTPGNHAPHLVEFLKRSNEA